MNLCNNKPPTPMTQIPWSQGITYSSKRPPETRRSLGLRLPKKPARCGLSLGIRNTSTGEGVSVEAATLLSTFHILYPFHRLQEFSQMSLHGAPGISEKHFLVKKEISANCSMYCILKYSGILVSVGNPGFCWLNKSVSVRAASPLKWASRICGKTH